MESATRLTLAALLTAIAAIHFYWAAGGNWGAATAIPSRPHGEVLFQPGRFSTAAVGALLLLAAAIALGWIPAFQSMLMRAMAAVFALRAVGDFRYAGFFKRVTSTEFAYWDTLLFSPLCLLLSFLALLGSN